MMAADDLENRVRELASEVEGEKAITRQVYQQAVRNGDALRAVQISVAEITSRVDHIVQEVIQNTAAVRTHGARLDTLTRDVGLLRNDQVLLRRDLEELRAHIDVRFDAVLEAIRALGPRQ
jgi:hypothetical protein